MKKLVLSAMLLVASVSTFAQNYTNDKAHSKLGFSVPHMTISDVEGEFKNFDVHLNFTKVDLTDAKFHVVADVNSINTGIEARDNHLKSADFFNASKNSKLEFTSKTISKVKGNNYKLMGDLSLNGVTKPVALNLIYNGSVDNQGVKTYGFTIKGKIKRSDFNIGTTFPEAVVGDVVTLTSNLEFATPKK
ncbi:YceI family protein [Faecalibacter rhinopitheci]|uniref:YceI family protein n=1 Tax=Faecalibacter rhinopitheci TaxID=2779678 RepID=A0A8J7FV73_9FLAO|nr:YceI family protein [Faecalibacter rhinopitheci]MBF0596043.1 YceI family protein [Faecalibacter rhinopitheci]